MLHIIFKHSQTWTSVDEAQQGGVRLITACAGGSSSLFKGGPVTQERVWKREASAFIISCSLSGYKRYTFWSKYAFCALHAVTSPDIAIKTRNTTAISVITFYTRCPLGKCCHGNPLPPLLLVVHQAPLLVYPELRLLSSISFHFPKLCSSKKP